jgi:hypothetical protein
MTVVLEEKPNLDCRIKRLQREHQAFRARLEDMAPDISALPALADRTATAQSRPCSCLKIQTKHLEQARSQAQISAPPPRVQ